MTPACPTRLTRLSLVMVATPPTAAQHPPEALGYLLTAPDPEGDAVTFEVPR